MSVNQQTNSGEVLQTGQGSPLFLFHGVTCTAHVWHKVIPLLSQRHSVYVPTALGHVGGTEPSARPVRIEHIIDDAERCLDRLGVQRAHLAGNSMGGWVALELARRGRALSVCALSPAGIWEQGHDVGDKLRKVVAITRATRGLIPMLARSPMFRRVAMRDNAHHGDRVARDEMLRLVDDMLGCAVTEDLLTTDESFDEPLHADCPVTIAWSQHDRIFPVSRHFERAKALVPDARFVVLDDVGHVPMLDNAELVADTILDTCAPQQTLNTPSDVFARPGGENFEQLIARAQR